MKYEVQENCLTIFLPGELDHHNAEEIRKRSDYLIDQNHIRYVIFDFTDTTFMDSSGIGLVMGRYKLCESMGASLEIHGLSRHAYKVMCLAGLQNLAVLKKKKEAEKSETA